VLLRVILQVHNENGENLKSYPLDWVGCFIGFESALDVIHRVNQSDMRVLNMIR